MENKHLCRICESSTLLKSQYPDAHFNGKVFEYLSCQNCNSFNVFPSPDEDDFSKMYGEEDHDYLNQINDKIEYQHDFPFAHYHGYQLKYLDKIKPHLKGKSLLDFACGSGFYMDYAKKNGANVTGIEFDEKFVSLLKEKTNLDIYTLEDAIKLFKDTPFDFIHLGHVLEHLTNPKSIIEELKKISHSETIFLIDGPLERNFCLHRVYVDFGSKLKGKKYRNAMPQHLTLTTQKSQLQFFNLIGLKKEKYWVTEQYFPLPSKLEPSLGKIISFLIANVSIFTSMFIPKSGNIFHYRGKMNE